MTPEARRNVATVRIFLLVEAVTFALAAGVHAGVLAEGWEHREAMIAESVIAVVLFGGLALTWAVPRLTRPAALLAQGFALLGTLVGILTIIVGVGPRTVPDVIYHVAIVLVLGAGIMAAGSLEATAR